MRAWIVFGLFALFSAFGGRAMAFGNCLDADYLAYFRASLAPQPCDDEYYTTIRATSGNALLRVIRLSSAPRGPTEDWRPQVEALAAGVGQAMDAIGTGRLPAEITVLLSDATETTATLDEVHADATRIPGGECRVAFYKLAGGASPEEFTFTLAHEIFHCVQFESWRGATSGAQSLWWMEGSAEYFAHLAAPDIGAGQDWIAGFDEDSLRLSLVEMEYQNVVFFAWLGSRGGPEAVGSFLTQMRSGDQLTVLRDLVPEADWISFVETWLDGRVTLPGGQPVTPGPMANGEQVFTTSGEIALTTRAYVIDRWGATFPEGKRFELTYEASGAASRTGMKLLDTGDPWSQPPARINTCEDEQRHIIYFTSTEGQADATLSVTTDEDDTGGACCLIGAWSPTQETLEGFASIAMQIGAGQIAAAGGNMSCGYASGGWILTFNEAGDGSLDYQANTNVCTISGRGGRMRFEESRSGVIGFDWEVVDEGAGMARYTENTLAWTIAIHIGPMVQNQEGPDAGPSLPSNGFAFTCEEDALTIQGLYGVSTAEATYLRFEE